MYKGDVSVGGEYKFWYICAVAKPPTHKHYYYRYTVELVAVSGKIQCKHCPTCDNTALG